MAASPRRADKRTRPVLLGGKVHCALERELAGRATATAPGVRLVQNELVTVLGGLLGLHEAFSAVQFGPRRGKVIHNQALAWLPEAPLARRLRPRR
jgi:hypothetical protein